MTSQSLDLYHSIRISRMIQITFEINIHHVNCLEAVCLGMYYHTLTSMN